VTRLLVTLATLGLAAWASAAAGPPLETEKAKTSYCIGLEVGGGLKRGGADIDAEALTRGIRDALSGAEPAIGKDEVRAILLAFQQRMQTQSTARQPSLGEQNKKDGDAFLAANAKKEGVKATASGLQYKITKAGTGATPKATDTVVTHYRGTLLDGTEFDSSHKRGQPAEFPVNGVIKGWTEALQLMKAGGKWQLFIPSHLAYGPRGAGRLIGPNATLTFEIEFLRIK